MDPTEAAKVTQNADELQDMCDDHLQEPAPQPEPDLSAELTKDIQRSPTMAMAKDVTATTGFVDTPRNLSSCIA